MENENVNTEETNIENNDSNETQDINNQDNSENKEFDPSAFMSTESSTNKETNVENNENTNTENDKEVSDENNEDVFSWDNYENTSEDNVDNADNTNNTDNNENIDSDNNSTSDTDEINKDSDITSNNEENQSQSSLNKEDAFKAVAEELNLSATNIDEFKNLLVEIQKENDELKNQSLSGFNNEKIKNLENVKTKTDSDLLRIDLKNQGFTETEIDNAIDIYSDNGTLPIEAKKIRNNIDKAINKEKEMLMSSQKNSDAKQQEEAKEAVRSLTEYINGVEKMFGFPIAKDEAKLKSIREGQINYITSGDFLSDVTKNNENLNEAAWMWKNRKTILQAFSNKGYNKGKQDLLNDIGNPDSSDTTRFKDPKGSDTFDPKKFTYGS
jgi:hypothetical protein